MSAETSELSVLDAMNEAPLSGFHVRAVLTSGMGFFTDAYDLFIIGVALALVNQQWHPTVVESSLVGSAALIATFIGAFVFGRLADLLGRKTVYGLEAAIMAVGAIATAFSPNIVWLIVWRAVLGIGIGGDYPVSAVIMSEFANRRDRGRLVGLVFSMQALGLIVGPLVALILLGIGVPSTIAWRLMLGFGAIPALAVIYLRRTMPESPRFVAGVLGKEEQAQAAITAYSRGAVKAAGPVAGAPRTTSAAQRMSLGAFLSNPRYLLTLLGTAGTWFVFDYAYYGNTISTPVILKSVAPNASLTETTALSLLIFVVFAAPGYLLASFNVDRIGHRRLQIFGFVAMGLCFLLLGGIPGVTASIVPFMLLYGLSYFFTEFGPNTTTFLMAAELYPVSVRSTGHGISAGIAKIGAFIGVFVFPIMNKSLGLNGVLLVAFALSMVGGLLTLVLPEPSGQTLEEVSGERAMRLAYAV